MSLSVFFLSLFLWILHHSYGHQYILNKSGPKSISSNILDVPSTIVINYNYLLSWFCLVINTLFVDRTYDHARNRRFFQNTKQKTKDIYFQTKKRFKLKYTLHRQLIILIINELELFTPKTCHKPTHTLRYYTIYHYSYKQLFLFSTFQYV